MIRKALPDASGFRLSRLFWAGVVLFAVGTGPLLIVILLAALGLTKDPNPNPVGFGILFFFTIWPSIGLMVAGWARSTRRNRGP
jgi:hypothetical protein